MAQPVRKPEQVVHIIIGGQLRIIKRRVLSQLAYGDVVAVLRIESHRSVIDPCGDKRPVHNIPQHDKDQQQLHKEKRLLFHSFFICFNIVFITIVYL